MSGENWPMLRGTDDISIDDVVACTADVDAGTVALLDQTQSAFRTTMATYGIEPTAENLYVGLAFASILVQQAEAQRLAGILDGDHVANMAGLYRGLVLGALPLLPAEATS